MIKYAFKLFVGLVLTALAVQGYASEVRPTGITLWDLTGPPRGAFASLGPMDYDNIRPGLEISGSAQTCWREPSTDQSGVITSTKTMMKIRRVYVPADPGEVEALATFDYQLESGNIYVPPPSPPPGSTPPQITYFREDGLALPYTVIPPGIPPGPGSTYPVYVPCNQFPYSSRFSMGIAMSGKTRVLVISEAMIGSYSAVNCSVTSCSPLASGNVSTYYLGVFNVLTGANLWEKTWPGVEPAENGGWSISTGRSIVAELLGKGKGDYVRIVRQKPISGSPGIEYEATVYDLLTGTEVQTTTFQISAPPVP